jgi:hypothetical protein
MWQAMPTTKTEFSESFVWQGPLAPWQAATIGIIAIVVIALLLWLEGRRVGTRVTWLFLLLRSIVLSLVLWMLPGPAAQTIRREITPKSIALIADVSLSMQTVDLPREREDLRWAASADVERSPAIVAADQGAFAARTGADRFKAALAILDSGGRMKRLVELVNKTELALNSARQHMATLVSRLQGRPGESTVAATRLSKSMSDDLFPNPQTAMRGVNSGTTVLSRKSIADLIAMGPHFETLAREFTVLSEQLATQAGTRTSSSQTRAGKVASVLQTAEKSWLKDIADDVRILRYQFDGVVHAAGPTDWNRARHTANAPPSPTNESGTTNLSAVLEKLGADAKSEMLAAAIVLTDGRHNSEGRQPIDVATSALHELPVYAVPIGSSKMATDVFVHHVDAPTAVIENDDIVIDAIVSAYQCAGETGVISLIENNEVLKRQTIEITSDRSDHRVSFTTKAEHLGRHAYQLRFDPLSVESNHANNVANVELDVIADKIRVLLADDRPRWEYRYLLNLFDRDKQIECDRLLFQPRRYGTGKLNGRQTLPDNPDLWSTYRVVILGDLNTEQLDANSQASLSEYVRRHGGTLVVIAGMHNMPHKFAEQPMTSLLPVEPGNLSVLADSGYSLSLTSAGRFANFMQLANGTFDSDRVWRDMSQSLPIQFLSTYSKVKPSGRILIRATAVDGEAAANHELAFLSWQDVGRGRVVYLASPTTYQLRLRHGDRYHHRFWGQLIRWAVARDLATGSTTIKISTDKPRYELIDSVQVVIQLMELDGTAVREATVHAMASLDNKVMSTIKLVGDPNVRGRYVGSFDTLAPGNYKISIRGNEVTRLLQEEEFSGTIDVGAIIEPAMSTEATDLRSNRPLLAEIASATGGQLIDPTTIEEVVRLAELTPHVQEETSHQPLWNRWVFLWIIIGCLVTEWILRKQAGLT